MVCKRSLFNKKLCYTLRNETEWIETVEQGANFIIKDDDIIDLPGYLNSNFDNLWQWRCIRKNSIPYQQIVK